MATAARAVFCKMQLSNLDDSSRREATNVNPAAVVIPKVKLHQQNESSDKILLQPRLCTLRSYGSDSPVVGIIRTRKESCDEVAPFFESLSEYIESSKKSHDFEIISGRLAMRLVRDLESAAVRDLDSIANDDSAARRLVRDLDSVDFRLTRLHLTATIHLRSGVVLDIKEGATLLVVGGSRLEDYPREFNQWYMVLTENASDVGITGGRTIDEHGCCM